MPSPDRLILRGAVSTGFGFAIRLGARLIFLFVAGHLFGALLFGAYSLGVATVEASVGLAGLSLKKTLFQMLDRHAARERGGCLPRRRRRRDPRRRGERRARRPDHGYGQHPRRRSPARGDGDRLVLAGADDRRPEPGRHPPRRDPVEARDPLRGDRPLDRRALRAAVRRARRLLCAAFPRSA